MSHNVIIYGAGGMAREVYEWSFCNGKTSTIGNVVGYTSDSGSNPDFELDTSLPYLDLHTATARYPNLHVLICIGDPAGRKTVAQELRSLNLKLHTYVHPSVLVAHSAKIGEGTVIYPFVVVSSKARIGECCVINSYTGVGHDVEMGDYCTLSAQVDLTGFVKLGEGVFMGSGTRVVPKKKIGAYSKISAGLTVIRSLRDHSVVMPKPTEAGR
jgi:sugar O-acyltransferase (sialic acid O-acetyltransferase NeuD family)